MHVSTSSLRTENNTTVRPEKMAPPLFRWGMRVLSSVAPPLATQAAERLFFKPRRRQSRVPHLEGIPAQPFRVRGIHEVQAWSWGQGPAVFLVHGWEGSPYQLRAFIRPLVESGHRVIALDLPAHGDSSGGEVSVIDFAEAIRAVAAVVGEPKAIIAHSLGATSTAQALSQGLGKVERVVLLSAGADALWFARQMASYIDLGDKPLSGLLERVQHRIGDRATYLPRLVGAAKAQALFVHDPLDPDVPFSHARALSSAWPGSHLHAVYDVGHYALLKDVVVVGQVLRFVLEGYVPEEINMPEGWHAAGEETLVMG